MALTTEGPLAKLVDLALHGPDVEVVNFKYLRTLLVEILKIIHVSSKFNSSLDKREISGITDIQDCNIESENGCNKKNLNGVKEYIVDDITRVMENQKSLEDRINKLEKDTRAFDIFPSNSEIFNITENVDSNKINLSNSNHFLNSQNISSNIISNINQDINNSDRSLGHAWSSIKTTRRLQVVEEGVDKLFSLMKEVLEQLNAQKENSANDLHVQVNQINENAEFKIKQLETKIAEIHENDWTIKLNKISDNTELKIKQLENIVAELRDKPGDDKWVKKLNSIDEKFSTELVKIQEEFKSDRKSCFGSLDNTEIKDIIESMQRVHKSTVNFNNTFTSSNDFENPVRDNHKDLDVLKDEINEIKNSLKYINGLVNSQQPSESAEHPGLQSIQERDLLTKNEKKSSDWFKNDETKDDVLKKTTYDTEDLISIQKQTLINSSDILSLQKNLAVIQNILSSNSTNEQNGATSNNLSDASLACNISDSLEKLGSINSQNYQKRNPNQAYEDLKKKDLSSQLLLLQEEQDKLFTKTENFSNEVREELTQKQKEIDVLYKQIENLRKIISKKSIDQADNNSCDKDANGKEDIRSEILDRTVSLTELNEKTNFHIFEERYQLIDDCLQDALRRIDTYVKHGTSLEDALNKLTEDLNTKMDSNTEGKLKKFLEERLKDIQKKCLTLLEDSNVDKPNAAGLRKPLGTYSCISCDRTIDVSTSGFMPSIPQKFPSKKTMAPYTSYELDQLRQQKFGPTLLDRSCGGQHTIINNLSYRSQKGLPLDDVLQKDLAFEARDISVGDCVVGTDGHIYRGKYQQNPKKSAHSTRKQGSPTQRVSHSAIVLNQKLGVDSKLDEKSHHFVSSRPHSADFTKPSSPVLPPIVHIKSAEDCRAEVF